MCVMGGGGKGAAGIRRGEARFAAYLDEIAAVLGHARRAAAARASRLGVRLPGGRERGGAKSGGPTGARTEPGRGQARHPSLHHVVAQAEWDGGAVLAAVRRQVL